MNIQEDGMTAQRLPKAAVDSIIGAAKNFEQEQNLMQRWSLLSGACEMAVRLAQHGFVEDLQPTIDALNCTIINAGAEYRYEFSRFRARIESVRANGVAASDGEDSMRSLPKAAVDALVEGLNYFANMDAKRSVIYELLCGACEVVAQLAENGFAKELRPVLAALTETLAKFQWGGNQDFRNIERRIRKAGGPAFLEAARA